MYQLMDMKILLSNLCVDKLLRQNCIPDSDVSGARHLHELGSIWRKVSGSPLFAHTVLVNNALCDSPGTHPVVPCTNGPLALIGNPELSKLDVS